MYSYEPQVLKSECYGTMIEIESRSGWSKCITPDRAGIEVKFFSDSWLELCTTVVEEPHGGIRGTADRMLKLARGRAISIEAKQLLERLMATYAINPTTNLVLGRFADEGTAKAVTPNATLISSVEDVEKNLTPAQQQAIVTQLSDEALPVTVATVFNQLEGMKMEATTTDAAPVGKIAGLLALWATFPADADNKTLRDAALAAGFAKGTVSVQLSKFTKGRAK